MDLSIIIVNWNTRDLLQQCLLSIEENVETCEPANVDTFVVDNASSDDSRAMIRERFPWVHLIENDENVGFARANNQAIHQSDAGYVVLLNSDTEVWPGAFDTMIEFMDAHPDVGACGPRLLNTDGSLQTSCHPMLTPWREFWRLSFVDRLMRLATYDMPRWDTDAAHEVEVIKGACLMLRRDALDQVGLLDERYFMYTEEMDLCFRMLHAGWELYWVPTAQVVHHGEGSTRQISEAMYVELYRSKVLFHRKFGGRRRVFLFKTLLALAYTPRWIVATLLGHVASETKGTLYRRVLAELPAM